MLDMRLESELDSRRDGSPEALNSPYRAEWTVADILLGLLSTPHGTTGARMRSPCVDPFLSF